MSKSVPRCKSFLNLSLKYVFAQLEMQVSIGALMKYKIQDFKTIPAKLISNTGCWLVSHFKAL